MEDSIESEYQQTGWRGKLDNGLVGIVSPVLIWWAPLERGVCPFCEQEIVAVKKQEQ